MASIAYSSTRSRWEVRWFPTGKAQGGRRTRVFAAEQPAREFAATLPAPLRRQGPDWTPQWLRTGCWIWQPKGGTNGYGQLSRSVAGRSTSHLAHRVSYEAFVGPIPDGLQIDHLCATPKCVNPAHLEPVTQVENIRRRDARKAVAGR